MRSTRSRRSGVGQPGSRISSARFVSPTLTRHSTPERRSSLRGQPRKVDLADDDARPVLRQIHALLHPTGSIWVHCDDSMAAHLRLVLDEVFLPTNFVGTIVWQKRTTRENRKAIGFWTRLHPRVCDVRTAGVGPKSETCCLQPGAVYSNPDHHPRGPWRSIPLSAQAGHATASQFYDITTPTGKIIGPPKGGAGSSSRSASMTWFAADRVYFPRAAMGVRVCDGGLRRMLASRR